MAGETLKVVAGNASGSSIPLESELVIGRSTPGLGSLGGDSEISRVHARVFHDPSGQLMVEDLGSTNGTFVNGNRISGTQPLRGGDQVRVGQTTMSVEGGAGGAEGATTVGNIVPAPVPPQQAAPPPPTQQLPPSQPPAPAYAQQPPPSPGFAGGPISGPPQRAGGGGSSKAPWYALAAVVLIALIVGGLAIGGVFGGDDEKKSASGGGAATTTPAATTTTPTTPAETTPAEEPPEAMMPSEPEPEPPSSTGGYPPGFISRLVSECSQKFPRSRCKCTYNGLKNAYTFPQLIAVLKKAGNGNIPAKARTIIQGCANA